MSTVATWNVLHRVHAENFGEDMPRRWPDERARIAEITALVVEQRARLLALQEVSGDQLAELRSALPSRTVHALRYPDVPAMTEGEYPLDDPAEHLVLIVDGPSREVAAELFPDAPGYGALVVRTAEALVVAAHLPGPDRLTRLAELAGTERPAILLGDFNTDRAEVVAGLGGEFTVAEHAPDAVPTWPRPSGGRYIDQVVTRGAAVGAATVEEMRGVSDHHLVRAEVSF